MVGGHGLSINTGSEEPPHSHPSIPYQSHGPGWRLQATEDRTGQDSVGRRHSTDPGFQIPSIPPLTPQILCQQPALVGWHPYILPQAHVLPQAHDLSGSGLLFPTTPTAPGP